MKPIKKTIFTKIALSLFLSLFILSSICTKQINALTSSNYLDVKIIKQEQTNWCWAACAEMTGKYYYKTFIGIGSKSQKNIVKYIKGNTNNVTGTLPESARANTYATNNIKTFHSTSNIYTWSEIRAEINSNCIVQLSAGYYNSSNTRIGGHIVVCNGWILNSSTDTYYVSYIDPYDGKEYFCTYSSFLDGSYNGRKYDGTVYC